MARILLIETATEVCSVALTADGKVVSFLENRDGFKHSELLTVYIERLFHDSGIVPDQIEAICVSRGPGSYTGLRIGVSVAKGMCFALDIPLIAISTIHSMAYFVAFNSDFREKQGQKNILLCPMLDARRSEVYTALFNFEAVPLTPVSAQIINNKSFEEELISNYMIFFGNGAPKCRHLITVPNAIFLDGFYASARFMSQLAEESYKKNNFENVAYFEPYYLKDFIATVPKNKLF